MPEEQTRIRAMQKKKEGKSPSTQAGEFVREEIHHIRQGKHGARNAKQAIAIGLSKARRAGVKLPARNRKQTLESSRTEPQSGASHLALSRHAHLASKARTPESRRLSSKKAVRTKSDRGRSDAGKKTALTRRKAAA